MLIPYTPISSLTEEQRARLKTAISGVQLESQAYFSFEGMTFSKTDLNAYFPKNEQKKPTGQPLFE